MKNIFDKNIFGIVYGVILIAFTAYALLDVFVIPHSYKIADDSVSDNSVSTNVADLKPLKLVSEDKVDTETLSDNAVSENASASDNEAVSENAADEKLMVYYGPTLSSNILDDSEFLEIGKYEDSYINITVNRYHYCDTYVFVADVYVASPDLLKTAFANDTFGRNINKRTSEIARDKGAILAVNGDFYGARQSGYVIRNGALYSETPNPKSQDLVIYNNGHLGIFNEADITATEMYANGARHVLSFGPGLVANGEIIVGERQEVSHASYSNPRTAIGYFEPCHYLFVVSDGRTDESKGLSLYQLATFMQGFGCNVAYNLDGGGSSTLVFQGQVINNPCPGYGYIVERSVSDIVYIGY